MTIIARTTAPRQRVHVSWIEQGYNARLMGLEPSDADSLLGDFHRYGWELADQLIAAQFDEEKPGLDPMPLPAWEELVTQAAAGRTI